MRLYDEYGTRTETEVCMYGLFVHSFCILFLGGCELLNTTLQLTHLALKWRCNQQLLSILNTKK